MKRKIGFIGSGNMAEAIIAGLLKTEQITKDSIICSDKSLERMEQLSAKLGIETTASNKDVFENSDVVILSVKPQNMREILEEIKPEEDAKSKKIIISIAAGIKTDFIERLLYSSINDTQKSLFPVSRVMPNTPGLAGAGMTGISYSSLIQDEDAEIVKNIFESMGKTIICKEDEMDAITAMSGSGPAYIFYFMESMISAGKKLGFGEEESLTLTLETIKGAVKLMETQNEPPESLRRKVTSPGGTTEAALREMESSGVKTGIEKGILAASDRSKELSTILCS